MDSLFDEKQCAASTDDLSLRVYTSRLLGRDKSLVLHCGGNTSVKVVKKNAFGEDEKILYVKGKRLGPRENRRGWIAAIPVVWTATGAG